MTGISARQAPRCFAGGVGMVSKDELLYWQANTKPAGLFDGLSQLASPTPASWNQITAWLQQIDGLRQAA